jgi:hypothetical protein
MQQTESRPSSELLFSRRTDELVAGALWFSFAVGVVGLLLALTYALAHAIFTCWVFVR